MSVNGYHNGGSKQMEQQEGARDTNLNAELRKHLKNGDPLLLCVLQVISARRTVYSV